MPKECIWEDSSKEDERVHEVISGRSIYAACNVLRANRECMQLTSCIVIIAEYVFAYDFVLFYMYGYCDR